MLNFFFQPSYLVIFTIIYARNTFPINKSEDINKLSIFSKYSKTLSITCSNNRIEETISLSLDKDLKWNFQKPPYITPLAICGSISNITHKCENPWSRLVVIFSDLDTGNNFRLTSRKNELPTDDCIYIPMCVIWESMEKNKFSTHIQKMRIDIFLEVGGISSPKLKVDIIIQGVSIFDNRIKKNISDIIPYQTKLHGIISYILPWKDCKNEAENSQICVPYASVLPNILSFYNFFLFSTDHKFSIPICYQNVRNDTELLTDHILYTAIEIVPSLNDNNRLKDLDIITSPTIIQIEDLK